MAPTSSSRWKAWSERMSELANAVEVSESTVPLPGAAGPALLRDALDHHGPILAACRAEEARSDLSPPYEHAASITLFEAAHRAFLAVTDAGAVLADNDRALDRQCPGFFPRLRLPLARLRRALARRLAGGVGSQRCRCHGVLRQFFGRPF